MSRTTAGQKGVPPEHNEAKKIGNHYIVRKSQWTPGKHPEPYKRNRTQNGYIEYYFECVDCGVEVLKKMDFPEDCGNNAMSGTHQ